MADSDGIFPQSDDGATVRVFDGYAGRLGWASAFLSRGWKVTAVDLVTPSEIPDGIEFIEGDMLEIDATFLRGFDFACFSSPCEQFSLHGMKHFFPDPPYPDMGIKLFNHTRAIAEAAGLPYVMENVRAAQKFVGQATNHCGPFYLWGTGVPPLMPQGIKKNMDMSWNPETRVRSDGQLYRVSNRTIASTRKYSRGSTQRLNERAKIATIPLELSTCVADYAEAILEQRRVA